MFADVSGSTKIYEELGDETAKGIMDQCLGHLQGVIESHKGIVIKKIGDELMCRFESADAAISAARESQNEIQLLQVDGDIRLSIWRIPEDLFSGGKQSTVPCVVIIWPPLAISAMRAATLTASPKMSFSSSITSPK